MEIIGYFLNCRFAPPQTDRQAFTNEVWRRTVFSPSSCCNFWCTQRSVSAEFLEAVTLCWTIWCAHFWGWILCQKWKGLSCRPLFFWLLNPLRNRHLKQHSRNCFWSKLFKLHICLCAGTGMKHVTREILYILCTHVVKRQSQPYVTLWKIFIEQTSHTFCTSATVHFHRNLRRALFLTCWVDTLAMLHC